MHTLNLSRPTPPDTEPERPRVPRPSVSTGYGLARMAMVRLNRSRIIRSFLAGLLAAMATAAALAWIPTGANHNRSVDDHALDHAPPIDSEQVDQNGELPVTSGSRQSAANIGQPDSGTALHVDDRILAVDRALVGVPLAVGDRVEVVGLRPTLQSTETVVVSADALVVGFDEEVLLLMMDHGEAYRAVELQAVGGLVILGR